jgi:hypothetical protein
VFNSRYVPDDIGLPVAAEINPDLAMEMAAVRPASARATSERSGPDLRGQRRRQGLPGPAAVASWTDEEGIQIWPPVRRRGDRRPGGKHGLIAGQEPEDVQQQSSNPDSYPNITLGTLLFSEGGSSTDVDAQTAYNCFGSTYDYFKNRFNRDSYNNAGLSSTAAFTSAPAT